MASTTARTQQMIENRRRRRQCRIRCRRRCRCGYCCCGLRRRCRRRCRRRRRCRITIWTPQIFDLPLLSVVCYAQSRVRRLTIV